MTVALSAIFLKERVRFYRWSAVILGFGGVLLMLAPQLDFASSRAAATAFAGAAFGFDGAFFAAASNIQTRAMTASETTSSIVLYFSLICRARDLAVWVADTELGGTRHAGRYWDLRRARAHSPDRKLSTGNSFSHRAIRLHLNAMDPAARLRLPFGDTEPVRPRRRCSHSGGRSAGDLARAAIAGEANE
jgi:hypothetical protein